MMRSAVGGYMQWYEIGSGVTVDGSIWLCKLHDRAAEWRRVEWKDGCRRSFSIGGN